MATPNTLFFLTTYLFIICNTVCCVVKLFYRPEAYRHNFDTLFPCWRSTAALFAAPLLAIPFLFTAADADALTAANCFTILLYTATTPKLSQEFFSLRRRPAAQTIVYYLPVATLYAIMLWQLCAMGEVARWTVIATTAVALVYLCYWVRIQIGIRRRLLRENEAEYSNTDDFPLQLARIIEWLPIMLFALQLTCLLSGNYYLKAAHDILLASMLIWLLIRTLNPNRKGLRRFGENSLQTNKLTDKRARQIEEAAIELIVGEKLFTDSHLTIATLAKRLNTNQSYVSEAISRGHYGTFYALVNSIRIKYAIDILAETPDVKMNLLAEEAGFSSNSVFSRAFKRHTGITPTDYTKKK